MQPDFSKYTFNELLEIERNIDRQLYPERYETVCRLINAKKNDPQEIELTELQDESNKIHRVLYVVALLWFFALYSIMKGEISIKSYTATYANEPVIFVSAVAFHIGFGGLLFFMYRKKYKELKQKK